MIFPSTSPPTDHCFMATSRQELAARNYDLVSARQYIGVLERGTFASRAHALVYQGHCSISLAQLQQTLPSAGCDLCRPHPIQIGLVVIQIGLVVVGRGLLDVRAGLGDRRRAS